MVGLVFGLGNPGKRYEHTRHNAGFALLDRLRVRLGGDQAEPFRPVKNQYSEICRVGPVRLIKPQTFMNESGKAVRQVCDFFKTPSSEILVVYDDKDLALGSLRFRLRGSAGGHNGVKSIISHLRTEDFPRLKLGIGSQSAGSTVGHVLGRFSGEEQESADFMMARAVEAVEVFIREGAEAAMSRFHGKPG